MSNYDEDGPTCPKCGSDDVQWEKCWVCYGEGQFDMHEEDPINYAEDEEYERCEECGGCGGHMFCHTCAATFRRAKAAVKP